MKNIIRYTCLLVLLGWNGLYSQSLKYPENELQRLLFVTEAQGLTSQLVNPAGLSTKSQDDGAMVSYDFFDSKQQGNILAGLSMGNLGFSYQSFSDSVKNTFQNYALALSIGGKFLAIGTNNRLVQIDTTGSSTSVYVVDAGITLKPTSWLWISTLAKNLNEPNARSYRLPLSYTSGFQVTLLDERARFFYEADWDRTTQKFDRVAHRGAIAYAPKPSMEFRVGGKYSSKRLDQWFGQVFLPGPGGISLVGTMRMNDKKDILRYSISILMPLETVRF